MKSCASGETGRAGERADRRNTAFPKYRLPKGDAETQAIIFIKRQKKTLSTQAAEGNADSEMRVFFCADERKMLRSEKSSSRLFRRSRGERGNKKGLLREIF